MGCCGGPLGSSVPRLCRVLSLVQTSAGLTELLLQSVRSGTQLNPGGTSPSLPRVPIAMFSSSAVPSAGCQPRHRVTGASPTAPAVSPKMPLPRLQLQSHPGRSENTHLHPTGTRCEHRLISSLFFLFDHPNMYSSVSGAGNSPKTLLFIVRVTFNTDDVGYSSHTWMSC